MRLQHSKTYYECFEIPNTDKYYSDHITLIHGFRDTSTREITPDSSKAQKMVTRAGCGKASTAKRDVSDHRATVHDNTSSSCKAIENHNCGISRQASKNKNRLEKHTRKQHVAANKQKNKS